MLPRAIRHLSRNRSLRQMARTLRLNHAAKHLYCRLIARRGSLQVSCLGTDVVFEAHDDDQLALIDYVVETERHAIETILSRLRVGDVFLDVGCHWGIYSVIASRLVGPSGCVIAVDADARVLEVLRNNARANGCHNIEIMNRALSERTAPLSLAYSKLGTHYQRATDPKSIVRQVEAAAGDEALSSFPVPTAVKVDVEGHEFAVLSGLRRTLSSQTCRALCLEIHPHLLPAGVDQEMIMARIRSYGFSSFDKNRRSGEILLVAER